MGGLAGRAARAGLIGIAAALFASAAAAQSVRVATFNASLSRPVPGGLAAAIAADEVQVRAVADVIRHAEPDVVLINEFDHDPAAAAAFVAAYLPEYTHHFTAQVNTGLPSGRDLDKDGAIGGAGDALGFGAFPGQYGMLVLSKFPIAVEDVRTFRTFLWRDMPDADLPVRADGTPFYDDGDLAVLPLSSKSHWDLPIEVDRRQRLHLLVSHPTPPVFDGPEDRNGRRNADEIRFWADYVTGARYIVDDAGRAGGLPFNTRFVIAGDLNADPFDGDGDQAAIRALLETPAVVGSATDRDVIPAAGGGVAAAASQKGANLGHAGDPAFDTADFGGGTAVRPDAPPGNLRVDYVLPSRAGLRYLGGGVIWPQPGGEITRIEGWPPSDHYLVWVDVLVR